MKKAMLTGGFLMSAICLLSCNKNLDTGSTPSSTLPTAARAVTYQLVWQDEFDGSSVNTSNWNIDNGNPGVNNEQEYYQSANATVTGGNLVITARKQSVGGQPYTSAKLTTAGKFQPTYGRIEARIKLPGVQGMWPAFWMLGANISDPNVGWPKCGEIDIMEQVNTNNTILGTMHWDAGSGHVQYGGSTGATATDYHVYAVEWDASSIRWYVDGTNYVTGNIANNINNTGAFHNPFYIILNLAVGGDLPGNTINDGALPTTMLVDYVRVYNMTNTSAPPIGSVISLKGSNGLYVSGENGTQAMTCNRTTADDWEKFTVLDAGNGKVSLRSMGKYVSSEDGTQAITCNRTTVGDWEKFTWQVQPDGTISLIGNNGKYISSENGTQAMTCNRTTAGAWEAFHI
ncbi:Beta-glucanase, GH16 family [Chitinophaga costaii]|uniref:Beta-glucanase, GH16 family n=1 Tax=Chitinophaga costaii TaxID=1335309 RepID=A0A1C4CJ69_9BACT|nr:family 16 glycosylhydrolase [Chitinophaga costaii]PUZ27070.1 glycoside hydrolase [Chitinophaga costaii]SCC19094.1 Beta-glucanase, GH16 family [Chitinophaga costaii]